MRSREIEYTIRNALTPDRQAPACIRSTFGDCIGGCESHAGSKRRHGFLLAWTDADHERATIDLVSSARPVP